MEIGRSALPRTRVIEILTMFVRFGYENLIILLSYDRPEPIDDPQEGVTAPLTQHRIAFQVNEVHIDVDLLTAWQKERQTHD